MQSKITIRCSNNKIGSSPPLLYFFLLLLWGTHPRRLSLHRQSPCKGGILAMLLDERIRIIGLHVCESVVHIAVIAFISHLNNTRIKRKRVG